jgi:hypothetical protein
MAGGRPDYTIAFPKIDKDGHTHWKQIGVGFNQRNGRGITIMLDSIPFDWGDGVLSVYPIRYDDSRNPGNS